MQITRRKTLGTALSLLGAGMMAKRLGAQTPRWHMPAEEACHEATFMQWPVSREVHPDGIFLDMLQDAIAEVANTIAEFEPVIMLMPADAMTAAAHKLSRSVEVWDIPTDDLWARDSGPVFLTDGAGNRAVTGFNFNDWGGKQTHAHDSLIAQRVAERMGLPFRPSPSSERSAAASTAPPNNYPRSSSASSGSRGTPACGTTLVSYHRNFP